MKKTLLALMCAASLSACVGGVPIATSHELVTPDRQHWAVQMSMWTGVQGTPVQTIMIVYNKFEKKPIATVQGSTLVLSDRLLDAVLALGPNFVTGKYILKAAQADCPTGTLCGTLVQVQNSAGATAGSNSSAGTTPPATTPGS